MRILQVNTADSGGGAEGSAMRLVEEYRRRGHDSWLAVGRKYGVDPDVLEIPVAPAPGAAGRLLQGLATGLRRRFSGNSVVRALERRSLQIADPERRRAWWRGHEVFHFPGSRQLLQLSPRVPDIVHCHNLHGWYFDLTFLPELSRQVPVVLNLRDAWLLTGHCAHFFNCERWKHGCGQCPDLQTYPAIRRDATAANWQRKAEIYAASRLYVTTISQWLADCVRESMLKPMECRVIPNGIDLDVFRPGDKVQARQALDLPLDRRIVLFAGTGLRQNPFKDYSTARRAMALAAARASAADGGLLFLCLGSHGQTEVDGPLTVRHVPFVRSPQRMAEYYRAADVYLHAARAEAFGKAVTEAMACGTPVVASRVGGIPEQVVDGQTGFLVPVGDGDAMAERLTGLLADPGLRAEAGWRAAQRGATFSLTRQVDSFLAWYEEIIDLCG
ncbi:MAG: hypothetical protein A3K19_12920 [Lentisphaerae bacterium RIFOXYB12_FULL_65_16]|nr:MAG: hypothetical protein A3K18_04785 [Lentisphaerae bacterium RIFOXYA12_64_32]OGV87214.1 MAG: hypothetical protein A3K19_12920 [Lentisphaerae bacterium RIFOXYB12_FULL_65_16]